MYIQREERYQIDVYAKRQANIYFLEITKFDSSELCSFSLGGLPLKLFLAKLNFDPSWGPNSLLP